MTFAMEPYLALVLIGFLPSEVWRWLGLAIGRGLSEDAPSCCRDLNVRRVYTWSGGRFALAESVDTPD